MTTNKPEVVAWRWRKPVVNDRGETVGSTDWELNDTPGFLPWWTNEPLVRLSDYEALQAAYEEELFQLRQTRDAHFGELVKALEQVDALQAECERWKRGSEIRDEQNQDLHSFIVELKAECEKLRAAIRHLCNIYVVDDYYDGQLREEHLDMAVTRAINAVMAGIGESQ